MTDPAGPVRAATLDAGGTLFHPSRPAGAVYAEVAARWGRPVDGRIVEERFAETWKAWSTRDPGRTTVATPEQEKSWWRDLVVEVFGGKGGFRDFDGFFEELYGAFAAPEAWDLYPDSIPALERLRAGGIPLAIVSNWDSRLDVLCDRIGIEHYFVTILASGRVGVSKPATGIFSMALRAVGAQAGETIHIGDSLRDDVHGALAAGMRAVWLRRPAAGPGAPGVPQAVGREGEPSEAAPPGVRVVASLDEAAGLVIS